MAGETIHLESALSKLSNKKSPNYRNSIKESISAVESIAKVISNNANDSLGAVLSKISGKIKLHSALEQGLKNIMDIQVIMMVFCIHLPRIDL